MNDPVDNEAYDEDIEAFDEEEEYEEDEGSEGFRRWGILAGIGVAVVCIGLAVVLWFGRETFFAPVAEWLASATPTATQTLPPTATFTPLPPTPTEAPPPSDTPPPAPPRQPAPEIMAQAILPPALAENFADNRRAWSGLGPNSEFLIQENRLIFNSNLAGQPAVVYCAGDCGPFKDSYYYEAEMLDERESEFGYGLIFAINDARNAYYAYKVRPASGEYGLFKLANGGWTPLIDWTKTPGLLLPPQTNILGVRLRDKTIDLFLNGERLASYEDEKPYNEGRIGFIVDQDGVRLIAGNLQVIQLRPTEPGQALTPAAPPGQSTATRGLPTPASRFTPTPTTPGSCPKGTPKDTWVLVVTNVGQGKPEIVINGVKTRLTDLISTFYLSLNVDYTIQLGSRTYEYNFAVCKIVYLKTK
jgi:hypothetical protein